MPQSHPETSPSEKTGAWEQFLQSEPALWKARRLLTTEKFIEVTNRIMRAKHPELEENLGWHAFEQCGWPEGLGYCFQHGDSFTENAFAMRHHLDKISPRLTLRLEHWKKPKRGEVILAARLLNEIIDVATGTALAPCTNLTSSYGTSPEDSLTSKHAEHIQQAIGVPEIKTML